MVLTSIEIQQMIESGVITSPDGIYLVDSVSITLRMGREVAEYSSVSTEPFVPPKQKELRRIDLADGDGYVLEPHGAALAASLERVEMPLNMMGLIQTRSSLARGFLMAHPSAGHVEPGYRGVLTLELVNLGPMRFRLVKGMPVAKMFFLRLTGQVPNGGYSGRYQDAGCLDGML